MLEIVVINIYSAANGLLKNLYLGELKDLHKSIAIGDKICFTTNTLINRVFIEGVVIDKSYQLDNNIINLYIK